MKYMISLATGLPSHFQIGDEALFAPSGENGIGMYTYLPADIAKAAPKVRIVSVKFGRGKVIYAVEVFCEYADGTGEWYEPFPLENIDSTFLHPVDQAAAYAAFLKRAEEGFHDGMTLADFPLGVINQ